jgi:hypothetical protein
VSISIIERLSDAYKIKINGFKDRLKHLSIELKSIKTMLEKCLNSWTKFNESFDLLEKWLNEKENKTNFNKVSFFLIFSL